jgi:transcriptional regulator with XRE-family HTH domain
MENSLQIPEHPLKQLLQNRNITQPQVAHHIGVAVSSLNQYLLGYRMMPSRVEAAITELLQQTEPGGTQ